MTGIGPHTMTTGLWVFVVLLNVGLVILAALAIRLAARPPRQPSAVSARRRTTAIPPQTPDPGGAR